MPLSFRSRGFFAAGSTSEGRMDFRRVHQAVEIIESFVDVLWVKQKDHRSRSLLILLHGVSCCEISTPMVLLCSPIFILDHMSFVDLCIGSLWSRSSKNRFRILSNTRVKQASESQWKTLKWEGLLLWSNEGKTPSPIMECYRFPAAHEEI